MTVQWSRKLACFSLWTLTLIYTIGVVLLHRRVNELADLVKKMLGLSSYLLILRAVGIIAIFGVLFWLYRKIKHSPGRLKILAFVVPLGLILDLSLIVVPIERIHYIQYGILTGLCYRVLRSPLPSALIAFFVGVIDEAYQYWVLYADNLNVYFDWNDITLNLMGVLAVLFFFLPQTELNGRWLRKPVRVAIPLWVLLVNLLVFSLNPDQYLIRNDPYKGSSAFWITSKINTNYHIMNSLEGLTLIGVILILTLGHYWPIPMGHKRKYFS